MKNTGCKYLVLLLGLVVLSWPAPVFAQEDADVPEDAVPLDETAVPSLRDLVGIEQPVRQPVRQPESQPAGSALPPADLKVRGGFSDGDFSMIRDLDAPTQAELQESIRQEAYDAALSGLFPLTPEQIKDLLKYYDKTTEAVEKPPYNLPEPRVAVQTVSLDPGFAPPTINVAVGHVTTLNMLDITGAPWPVLDVSWAGNFEVVEPLEGGHMIRITPMAEYAYGNISVRLLTLKTPITFSLRTARDTVHYRMDARIPEYGPMAEASLIQGGTELAAGSPLMTSVLDGVPPGDVVRMDVSGVDGRTTAYKINGLLYVRTPLSLLSPGWESSVSSADGMHVYALNDSPVILLSDRGKFMRATLSEKRDIFDE